ncbi:MAG: hypothetical protein HY906_08980 [Deltaproteobacteria bacterium]|nr:hypothetical protein [Deltaproteobacteria bacterium]
MEIERRVEEYARGRGDLAQLFALLLEPHRALPRGDARTPPLEEIRQAYQDRLRFLHSCRAIRDGSATSCRPLAALGRGPDQWCDGHLLLYRTLLRPMLVERRCDVAAIRRAARPAEEPPPGVLGFCEAVSQRRADGCAPLPGHLRGLCLALVYDDVARCAETGPRPARGGAWIDGDCRHFFQAAKALAAGDPKQLAPDADASAYVGAMLGTTGACEDRFLQTMRALLRGTRGPALRD